MTVNELQAAISDYTDGGMSRTEVAKKYGISPATLGRHFRRFGVQLDPNERARRRARGGQIKRVSPASKCHPGCRCPKHANPPVCGRRFCTDCNRWRHLIDFYARERDQEGNALAWQSVCVTCTRIRQRIRKGIERRGVPYEARKPRMSPQQQREHRRKIYHEKMQDPEYRAMKREYQRIYAEAKRREAGIPSRKKGKTLPGYGERLPNAPMKFWIEQRLSVYAGEISSFASACGVSERIIWRIRKGEQEHISEDLADQILLREGSTDLWEVYPHLYA